MSRRIGMTALACLSILKTAGFTNENLPQQLYEREEDYVAALVEAFDRANVTGAHQAGLIESAIKSVENNEFHVCAFTLEDGTKSVTLVPTGETCESEQAIDDVTKYRLMEYLERVKSFINPIKQNVFGFAQSASNAIRETVYTLKDALLATALSRYGGFGFLIAILWNLFWAFP